MGDSRSAYKVEIRIAAPEVVAENASGTQRSLKILIVASKFLPLSGGVQTYVYLLAKGLTQKGHLATVVTGSEAFNFDDEQLSFPVERRPSLFRLWRMIGKTQILHLAGPTFIPLLLGLLRRKPIFMEHHGYQAICPNGMLLHEPDQTICPGHFMTGAYQKCLRCVAVTDGYLSSVWKLLCSFPRHWMCQRVTMNAPITQHVLRRLSLPRSNVIYYGIPDAPLDSQPLVSICNSPLRFAYVGRLVAEKGLPTLVEAAGRLRNQQCDFHLKFVGDGPERLRLEQMVAACGISDRVTFTGFLSGELFRRATEDVAAVVMPSICEETAGLAAMEQMMRGRLVIVSDIGGLGEVVDSAGLKFAAGNVDQLTARMKYVIDHPEIVATLGAEARRRCLAMFHEEQMINNHVSAYLQSLPIDFSEASDAGVDQ